MERIKVAFLVAAMGVLLATTVSAADQSEPIGTVTEADASLTLSDYLAVWDRESGELSVLLTPTEMTDEERETIRGGKNAFHVIYDKESPADFSGDWYPYVEINLTLDPAEVSPKNIDNVHVVIYGVPEENHTTNLNPFPEDARKEFSSLSMADGALSLSYEGSSDAMDVTYDISF